MATLVSIALVVGILLLIFTSLAGSSPGQPTYVVMIEPQPRRSIGCAGPILFFFIALIIIALLLP
ncbi:MAG TPA: hypothetical protein VFT66_20305 [Roseiflexaceae bacterium]|nr:hypothetical protein [Roseiflexaceae bacterium]